MVRRLMYDAPIPMDDPDIVARLASHCYAVNIEPPDIVVTWSGSTEARVPPQRFPVLSFGCDKDGDNWVVRQRTMSASATPGPTPVADQAVKMKAADARLHDELVERNRRAKIRWARP